MRHEEGYRAGTVALLGRPNVGKSTLLNRLVGQKVAITASKPQTTRFLIRGVDTTENYQAVYLDVPGILAKMPNILHRSMQQAVSDAILQADVLLFVCKALRWTSEDVWALEVLSRERAQQPVLAVVNFVDAVKQKSELMPFLKEIEKKFSFQEIIPISAFKNDNIERLRTVVARYLPSGEALFSPDTLTDCSMRTLAAEFLREQCLRQLHAEVPHQLHVTIEQFSESPQLLTIDAVVWLAHERHKGIVLGQGGEKMRSIATAARLQMEKTFENKVMLKVLVKVKAHWADDPQFFMSS